MCREFQCVLVLAISLVFAAAVHTTIIHVPGDSATVQGGINGADHGDTVLVARGLYFENISFLGKGIIVASEYIFELDTVTIDSTILDGSDTSSVVTFNCGEDTTAQIQGFTIRNGNSHWSGGVLCDRSSPTVTHNVITENTCNWGGAGIACINQSFPMIKDNRICENSAGWGGGIACDSSSPTIVHNVITHNLGVFAGGGIFALRSSPTISRNLIANNRTQFDLVLGGGGICCIESYSMISWNKVVGNNAASCGGGIYCDSSLIFNNLIIDNVASEDGGGIYCGAAIVGNNTIAYNSAPGEGGGVCCVDSAPSLYNNVIVNSMDGEGISCDTGASPWVHHNDVWNNADGDFAGCPAYLGDTTWGINRNGTACDSFYNILKNPLFASSEADSLFLSQIEAGQPEQSPCVDAGSVLAESLGLSDYTTRTDSVADAGLVDMGYHYPWGVEVGIEEEYAARETQNAVMRQNYPNPFNNETAIQYSMAEDSRVSLKVYNALGQEVRLLVDELQQAGTYSVIWDSRDRTGRKVSSGRYFLHLEAHTRLGTGDYSATRKVCVVR